MAIVKVEKNSYTVEPLYQWDTNQVLEIRGLSLPSIPEIHFTNEAMDRAIVRQASVDSAGIVSVSIPNSLLQKPYKITAYVCVYTGATFESLYKIEIPVKARTQPSDYTLTDDEEIYSFKALENAVSNALVACGTAEKNLATATTNLKNAENVLKQATANIGDTVANEVSAQAVKKTGDIMTGSLEIRKADYANLSLIDTTKKTKGLVEQGNNLLVLRTSNTDANSSNQNARDIRVYNSLYTQNLLQAVQFVDIVDGKYNYYPILHTGNLEALGSARVAYGTVTGSTKASEASPNSITFPFEPKLVIVTGASRTPLNEYSPMRYDCFFWTPGVTSDKVGGSDSNNYSKFDL